MSVHPYITTGVALAGAGILLASGSSAPLPGVQAEQSKPDVAQKTLTPAEAVVTQAGASAPAPLAILGFIPARAPAGGGVPGVVPGPGLSAGTGPTAVLPAGISATTRVVASNSFAPEPILLTVPQTGGGGATPNALLAALTPDGANSARSMAFSTEMAAKAATSPPTPARHRARAAP